jgi:hypothetical protein
MGREVRGVIGTDDWIGSPANPTQHEVFIKQPKTKWKWIYVRRDEKREQSER